MIKFGIRLRALRKERKLTQKVLADRLGLATSAICSYEAGTRYPSYEVLIKVAGIFRVSTDYLLGIEKNRYIDVTGLLEEDIEILTMLADSLRKKKK
ncbi:DNA-binding XRE family transcriptional regulator [Kineothrix alysoides]|uniref:DNA-binding XRE family transcriptional regulator n=1 Tax=Kineothrix alysoides TaxID=1469948 RepID=A0A4R1QKW9_9FIRM|nr:helix-turn-helix transcriptional regulator [Kineothrix alysoides]TCL54256.1 DNA-binding XRE family transcriptional regulator [Kineothrix alysoides]